MKILSIETSCDETAISIVEFNELPHGTNCEILANALASQIELHKQYGGVFPMMAKREHQKNIVPLLLEVLNPRLVEEGAGGGGSETNHHPVLRDTPPRKGGEEMQLRKILDREPELLDIFLEKVLDIPKPDIDAIAVTVGPGLEPALWVGINFAKALSYLWDIPVIAVNHMEGHIFSIFPTKEKEFLIPNSKDIFPIVSLLVSGGHTELILAEDWGQYTVLGQTVDDAAGEAFDKVARMLDLPYPGGPEISRLAEIERVHLAPLLVEEGVGGGDSEINHHPVLRDTPPRKGGEEIQQFKFPRPMMQSKDYNFSFSGLKTSILYTIRDLEKPLSDKTKQEIAKEFEDAVIDVLVSKTLRAVGEFNAKTLIVGGGVSANNYLKKIIEEKINKEYPEVIIHFPLKALSTDNAIMIALAGYFDSKITPPTMDYMSLKANGNLSL